MTTLKLIQMVCLSLITQYYLVLFMREMEYSVELFTLQTVNLKATYQPIVDTLKARFAQPQEHSVAN